MIERIKWLLYCFGLGPYQPVVCLEGKHFLSEEEFKLEVDRRKNTCRACVDGWVQEYVAAKESK